MIELWRTRRLAEQLRSTGLREKERLIYFVVFCVGFLPRIELGLLDVPLFPQKTHWAYLIASAGIVWWGSVQCYREGSREAPVNFFGRFICLAVPLSIKLVVLETIARVIALKIIGAIWAADEERVFPAGDPLAASQRVEEVTLTLLAITSVISLVFLWLFFARMKVHLAYSAALPEAVKQQ